MLRSSVRLIGTLAAVLRAAVRVGCLEPKTSLPELVERLRDTPPRRNGAFLDPALALGLVEALLPLFPPYGAGRCMKRSLLLLDLWSRSGLSPSLHLGVRVGPNRPSPPSFSEAPPSGGRSGHAWISTIRSDVRTFRAPDVIEAWRA